MGFLTLFPPYLSPCSLATFFRKQQRQKLSSVSLNLHQEENLREIEQNEEEEHQQIQISVNRRSRRRLWTVRPNWIMHSYNRHIRNQTFLHTSISTKIARPPPIPLSNFSLVPVYNCRISNRTIPSRRPETCECCPIARSGHRIFADEDFIYILGGYNQIFSNDKTYTDAWRFNRLTQQWQVCSLAFPTQPLPNTLASFSLVSLSPENPFANGPNEVYIFGGTGFPFGQEATNKLHRIRIDSSGNIFIKVEQWESDDAERDENGNNIEQIAQVPPRMYGHAMCYRLETGSNGTTNEAIYLTGGTSGHIYNMDIWRLERPVHSPNSAWKSARLNMYGFETGRYRLEAVLHEQMVYTFGGGAPDFCAEFDEILAFNLLTRKFELHKTQPDPVFGLPRGRKCHAMVQKGNMVYIIGGCRGNSVSRGPPEHEVINDVWRFNLDSLSWIRIRTSLPLPVYFHSAALTPDGCIFVFGGCMDEDGQSQTRVNHLQRMWLTPPSLKYFASTVLLENMPESQRQRIINKGIIRLSNTEALVSLLFEASVAA